MILALCLAVTSCAPEPALRTGLSSADGPCFLPQTVVNFTAADDTTAYVRAGRNEVFQIQSGFCRGLRSARSLSVAGGFGTGARACVGQSIDIVVAGPSLTNENNSRCRATVTRRLTQAEIEVLPSRLRP